MKRLLVIALLVGACSAPTAATPVPPTTTGEPPVAIATTVPAPTAAPTPTAVPMPSPTPDPEAVRQTAVAAYVAAIDRYNERGLALEKQYRHTTSLKPLKVYCGKRATNQNDWNVAMLAITFPADMAADVKALIRASAAEVGELRSCSEAKSVADWNRFWNLAVKAEDRMSEAASLVRLDLETPR